MEQNVFTVTYINDFGRKQNSFSVSSSDQVGDARSTLIEETTSSTAAAAAVCLCN